MIKIIVDSQELKNKILLESKFIHDLECIDGYDHSDKASTLMHIYMNPDLIEVNQNKDEDSDLEEVLKKLEGMKPSIIQEYIDKQREINFNINNQNKEDETNNIKF